MMALLVASACGAPTLPSSSPAVTPALPTPSSTGGPYFPRHNLGPDDPQPEALVRGRLQLVGDCIVLHSESGTTYLPIWPPNFRLADNQAALILDGSGQVIPFGNSVVFAGGEFHVRRQADVVSRLLSGHMPPADCSIDLVWVVTMRVAEP